MNEDHPGRQLATQNERVLRYLQEFGAITALEALRDLGVMRLAARVHDLRSQGHAVKAQHEVIRNRWGQAVTITRYTHGEAGARARPTSRPDAPAAGRRTRAPAEPGPEAVKAAEALVEAIGLPLLICREDVARRIQAAITEATTSNERTTTCA